MHITYKIVPAGNDESHVYEVYNDKYTHKFTGTPQEAEAWVKDKNTKVPRKRESFGNYFKDFSTNK